jgi:acyl-CoA thioesterase YciA
MTNLTEDTPLPNGRLTLRLIPNNADTNASGDISGGWVLNKMDMAAEDTARMIAQGRVTMVGCESTAFLSPVKIGKAICCYTKVLEIGRSSMQVRVEVWSQNTYYDEITKVCESTFTYVAIDESGRIRMVPEE